MKLLVTWQIHEGQLHDTLALFAQMSAADEKGLMGAGVKLEGRWHDLVRGEGAAIFEVESAEDFTAYSLSWNRFMDLDIAVVVDDEGARKLAAKIGDD